MVEEVIKTRKITFNKNAIINYVRYKLGNKLTYKEINRIITMYHNLLFEDMVNGSDFLIIKNLGSLKLSKFKREAYLDENGNLINNLPINYPKTYKLWEKHPEFKNIKFVRCTNEHSNGYMFALRYFKSRNGFNNSIYYSFAKNNTLSTSLSKNIKNGKVDALLGKTY